MPTHEETGVRRQETNGATSEGRLRGWDEQTGPGHATGLIEWHERRQTAYPGIQSSGGRMGAGHHRWLVGGRADRASVRAHVPTADICPVPPKHRRESDEPGASTRSWVP